MPAEVGDQSMICHDRKDKVTDMQTVHVLSRSVKRYQKSTAKKYGVSYPGVIVLPMPCIQAHHKAILWSVNLKIQVIPSSSNPDIPF